MFSGTKHRLLKFQQSSWIHKNICHSIMPPPRVGHAHDAKWNAAKPVNFRKEHINFTMQRRIRALIWCQGLGVFPFNEKYNLKNSAMEDTDKQQSVYGRYATNYICVVQQRTVLWNKARGKLPILIRLFLAAYTYLFSVDLITNSMATSMVIPAS